VLHPDRRSGLEAAAAVLERRLRDSATDVVLRADLQVVLGAVQSALGEERDLLRRIGDRAVTAELDEAHRELSTAPEEAVTAAARSLEALLKGLLGGGVGSLGDLVKTARKSKVLPTEGAVSPALSAFLGYVGAVRNQKSDAHHVSVLAGLEEARFVVRVAEAVSEYVGATARSSSQKSSSSA